MGSYRIFYGEKVFANDALRLQEGLNHLAEHLVKVIKASMPVDGGYRRYKRPWGEHWSSHPGNPPAIDYGRLHDSISYNYPRSGMRNGEVEGRAFKKDGIGQPRAQIGVRIGTKTPYAGDVEEGHGNVAARPFLAPWAKYSVYLSRMLDERLIVEFKKK